MVSESIEIIRCRFARLLVELPGGTMSFAQAESGCAAIGGKLPTFETEIFTRGKKDVRRELKSLTAVLLTDIQILTYDLDKYWVGLKNNLGATCNVVNSYNNILFCILYV